MAGVGLDANMLAHTDDELKAKIGWLAYLKALALALRDTDLLRLRYTLDGRASGRRARTRSSSATADPPGQRPAAPRRGRGRRPVRHRLMRPETLFHWVQTS